MPLVILFKRRLDALTYTPHTTIQLICMVTEVVGNNEEVTSLTCSSYKPSLTGFVSGLHLWLDVANFVNL